MPFVAYCIYAEMAISHSARKLFKSRSKTAGARKVPFVAYFLYAEGRLTPLPRIFQRLSLLQFCNLSCIYRFAVLR